MEGVTLLLTVIQQPQHLIRESDRRCHTAVDSNLTATASESKETLMEGVTLLLTVIEQPQHLIIKRVIEGVTLLLTVIEQPQHLI